MINQTRFSSTLRGCRTPNLPSILAGLSSGGGGWGTPHPLKVKEKQLVYQGGWGFGNPLRSGFAANSDPEVGARATSSGCQRRKRSRFTKWVEVPEPQTLEINAKFIVVNERGWGSRTPTTEKKTILVYQRGWAPEPQPLEGKQTKKIGLSRRYVGFWQARNSKELRQVVCVTPSLSGIP